MEIPMESCFFIILPVFVSILFIAVIVLIAVALIGKRTSAEISPKTEDGHPRLVRIPQKQTIAGICAGFAYKLGTPPWLVQVIWVVLAFGMGGVPLIAYPILWIVMPKASESPEDYDTRTERF
jgi:phage shock protein PspC (stress-responsive transcriptional regulator)